jgi:hypothetical protein
MLVSELIDLLKDRYEPDEAIAVAIWNSEDVLMRAKDRDITLTQEEADTIINNVDRNQDAEFGIAWDNLDFWTDDLIGDKDNGDN